MGIYLDNAATTAIDPQVFEAMLPYLKEEYGNPSSIHGFGRNTKAAIEKARKSVANHFQASVGEIFFTSGGTESANLIIQSLAQSDRIAHIISTKIEHHCVLHSVEEMAAKNYISAHYLKLDEKGNIDFSELEDLLKKYGDKSLIALMHANNEIGTLLNLQAVAELSREYGTLFFSDTVQSVAHYNIDLQKTPVDFITGSAHKFHGPKGVGFVYINSDVKVQPLIFGGSQERNMRAGTENIYGIVGMAKALDMAYETLEANAKYISGLKQYFFEALQKAIPGVEVNGAFGTDSLYTVLNVSFPKNEKTEFLLYNLDIEGIAVSAGSACTSGSDQGSHVL
ncbi:MAG: cysteine desulfurase family protein, partial [Chitinophagales bacterium]